CSTVESMNKQHQLGEAFAAQYLSRRGFLSSAYTGLAAVGLTGLLSGELFGRTAAAAVAPMRGGVPHFAPRAKRVLQIFCPGAASHMDLWEHKPDLEKFDGTPLPGEENLVSFQGKNGNLMRSPWP